MEDKLKVLLRIGKLILAVILGIIALAVLLAYKMVKVFGLPEFQI